MLMNVNAKEQFRRACWNIFGLEGKKLSASQLSHLSLTDEQLKICNLSPDLVLFADEVMDTLGQLLLVREKISGI